MEDFCPNCETQVITKHKEGLEFEQHQHQNHLDLENCPECGFNFTTRDLAVIENKHKSKLPTTPPENSKIDSFRYSESVLEITVPREGLSRKVTGPLMFSILWLLFLAFWTSMALQGSIIFALMAIPFWSTGLSMFYGTTKAIFESQKIELNGNNLVLTKGRLLNSKKIEIPLGNIKSIEMKRMSGRGHLTSMARVNRIGSRKFKVPTLTTKDGEVYTLLEYGSDKERIWLTNLLKEYMSGVYGSAV